MSKMFLKWGEGNSDILLDLKSGRLFRYEDDFSEVHKRYGGKVTYTSRTGLTGEGYITDTESVIMLDWYRTDCSITTRGHYLPFVDTGDIAIFAPQGSHEKEWNDGYSVYPFVIVFKHTETEYYFFLSYYPQEIIEILKNILEINVNYAFYTNELRGKFKFKEYNITIYNNEYSNIKIYVNDPYFGRDKKGVDFLRFVSGVVSKYNYTDYYTEIDYLYSIFGIYTTPDGRYYKVKFYNGEIAINQEKSDPLFSDNETIEKWTGGKVIKRDTKKLLDRIVIERRSNNKNNIYLVAYGKYKNQNNMDIVDEYELKVTYLAYMLDKEKYIDQALKHLRNKFKEDIKQKTGINEMLDFIRKNPDLKITFEDSLNSGNCIVGTEAFSTQYFNKAKEIMLKDLENYLNNYNVQRVIRWKMEQRGCFNSIDEIISE